MESQTIPLGFIKYRIKVSDTDCGGRVFFPSYVRLLNEAILHMFRVRGVTLHGTFSLTYIDGKPLEGHFVVGEYSCRIEAPSQYDDVVIIEVWIKKIGEHSITFEGQMVDTQARKKLASGWITYVYVQNDKSKKIPAELIERIKATPKSSEDYF
ncbi:MAG: acyl-CoA thioesterase [Nitrososphaerales archaeon]